MDWWKIIKVISATIGEFQKAASDGVITLEDAFGILKSALDKLDIKLNLNVTASEVMATIRRLQR